MPNNGIDNVAPPQDDSVSQEDRDYMRFQYQEGANTIRAYIDCRYKILQFIGFYNAAVLTLGFNQGILSTASPSVGSLLVCALSALVSLMGLTTEYSLLSYNIIYYEVLRKIEYKLGGTALPKEIGIFTYGRHKIGEDRFHSILPVNRAHKLFYFLLLGFWTLFFIYGLIVMGR